MGGEQRDDDRATAQPDSRHRLIRAWLSVQREAGERAADGQLTHVLLGGAWRRPDWSEDLAVAYLDCLREVPLGCALPIVRALAESGPAWPGTKRLQAAAQACLPVLEEYVASGAAREAERRRRNALLRPAEPPDGADRLLRPADGVGSAQPERLLRPAARRSEE